MNRGRTGVLLSENCCIEYWTALMIPLDMLRKNGIEYMYSKLPENKNQKYSIAYMASNIQGNFLDQMIVQYVISWADNNKLVLAGAVVPPFAQEH